MIERRTNLSGVSVSTNHVHSSEPKSGHWNGYDDLKMDSNGILFLKFSNLKTSEDDQISNMRLLIPIKDASFGVRFYVREVQSLYGDVITWNTKPSVNMNCIEAEHIVGDKLGSGMSMPNPYFMSLDLTNLAKKWERMGMSNTSIAIYTTSINKVTIMTPRNWEIFNKVEVLSVEIAKQTGLSGHLSFTESEVGFAGKTFVNNLTGKLLTSFAGFSTESKKSPIVIGAFYAQEQPQSWGLPMVENLMNDQRKSMPGHWRTNFDYGVRRVDGIIRIDHPDGTVGYFEEIEKSNARRYGIETKLDKVYVNYFDFSYIEKQDDLTIIDKQMNKLVLTMTGLVKSFQKKDGSKITFRNDGSKITSINSDGKNVVLTYVNNYLQRADFIEEAKSLYFEYCAQGPSVIKLQDINYATHWSSSGSGFSTKIYLDKYTAKYEYILGIDTRALLYRVIDLNANIAAKFDFENGRVIKNTLQLNGPLENGAYSKFYYGDEYTRISNSAGKELYYCFNNYGQCIHAFSNDGAAVSMRYGITSNVMTQQMLKEESPIVHNVRNQIINHSFDEMVEPISSTSLGWRTNDPSSLKVIDGGVYGDKCLRVKRLTNGTTKVFQTSNLKNGNYTLSFFTKSKDVIGEANINAKITYTERRIARPGELAIVDPGTGEKYVTKSGSITKNSANIVGNEIWTRYVIEGLNVPMSSTSAKLELSINCNHSKGEIFFDDFQMMSPHKTTYNLIQNGYFDLGTTVLPAGWMNSSNFNNQDGLVESQISAPFDVILGAKNIRLTGNSEELKTLSTNLQIEGGAGEEFTIVSWAKGHELNDDIFRVKVIVDYPGFSSETFEFDFDKKITNWQMLCRGFITSKPYNCIRVSLEHMGPNTVNFDSIQLHRNSSGKHYSYDERGNLIDQMIGAKNKSTMLYDDKNNVTQSVDQSGNTYKYIYDDKDQVIDISDSKGNRISLKYDSNGNKNKSIISSIEGELTFGQSFDNKNRVTSTSDELGNKTTISYDSKGRMNREIAANGISRSSAYDAYDNLIQLIQSGGGKSTANSYSYNKDQTLKSITANNGTKYDFVYDAWGKLKQVKVNNKVFASYEHEHSQNGIKTELVTKLAYGVDSQEAFEFSYDLDGRVQTVRFRGVDVASYKYNDKNLVCQIDTDGISKFFSYDSNGNLVKETSSSGKIIRFDYDNLAQVQKATYDINGVIRSYDYEYTNEYDQYSKNGFRNRIANAFGDDICDDTAYCTGLYGMKPELNSETFLLMDDILKENVVTLTKNYSRIVYDLSTVNVTRKTGENNECFNETEWKTKFIYNKSFFGWFNPVGLADEMVIFSIGKDSIDYWKVLVRKEGAGYIFTLKYAKDEVTATHGSITVPSTNGWTFVGLKINKAGKNTEIGFAVGDKYITNVLNETDVTYLINKAVVGDRSQAYGVNESNTKHQLQVHMLSIGAYKHTEETFGILDSQGNKYLTNFSETTPKTGVAFENPEIYDQFDTISLNGTFISKNGIKPQSYSYADKSFALDKTRLFEYDHEEGKHIYGSYEGLKVLSDGIGKLVYDFDIKEIGTMSIRFKPLIHTENDRIIISNKIQEADVFGAVLKNNNEVYMIINGHTCTTQGVSIPSTGWSTVVLKWDNGLFQMIVNGSKVEVKENIKISGAKSVIGSGLYGNEPSKHLNGQLEMLAYTDKVVENTEKLFQSNQMMSVKTHVDVLGRIKMDVIDTGLVELINEYKYKSPGNKKTSLQIESIKKYDESITEYEYDVMGNIIAMVTPDGKYIYEYDYLGRLVKEYNPINRCTMLMNYTGNNNISTKKYYNGNEPLTTIKAPFESYEYQYSASWKDQLIRITRLVNGNAVVNPTFLSYNSNFMGNPSNIGDKQLIWKGRRLNGVNSNIQYKYDEIGNRISKTIDGLTTNYVMDGSNIIEETKNGATTKYIYNDRGMLVGFEYLKKQYYYIRDLLGIITEIVDENGDIMVSYKYDAWGKIIDKYVANTKIDEANNFIYKGYYYDKETKWYYLKTRYYCSQIGRFINADDVKYLDPSSINGINLYAYCSSNPVNMIDSTGTFAISLLLIGFFAGTAIGLGGSVISQGVKYGWDSINWGQVSFDGLIGGITGLIGGSGIGIIGSIFAGGVLGFAGSVGSDLIVNGCDFGKVEWARAVAMGLLGAGLGALSGAGAGNVKAMNSAINGGKSWGSKAFLNFGVSVADKGATQLARQTASFFLVNAILGFKVQAFTYLFAGMASSIIVNSIIS